MAFIFQLSTDAIRTKMFDFIKPVYRNTWDFKVDFINWTYGVYEDEHDFFITYVNSDRDDDKYVILTGNDEIFYVSAYQYQHTLSEVPEQLAPYRETIYVIPLLCFFVKMILHLFQYDVVLKTMYCYYGY